MIKQTVNLRSNRYDDVTISVTFQYSDKTSIDDDATINDAFDALAEIGNVTSVKTEYVKHY